MTKKIILEKNFIDRAIEFVAPVYGAKRQQARMVLALSGGYSGAKTDRAALSRWNALAGSPEADISPDLVNLRSRSRDLVRNTPIATGAVALATSNVVGTGLSLQPTIDYEFLGLDETAAAKWAIATKREWQLFANSKEADITRHLNFYQLQSLVYRSRMESGDIFVLTPSLRRNSVYELTLQLVEADRVCNEGNKANTGNLVDGIELDEYGAPVMAHILREHPGTLRMKNMKWDKVPFYGENGRRNVLHIYKQFRPGQVRGVPDFAPIIEPLKQLGRYTEAELQAAVTSGMFAMFSKIDPEAFGEIFNDDAQKTIIDGAKKWDGAIDNGGRVVNLLPGEEIQTVNPARPNAEFDPFVQAIIRQIGMALEIPYEVLIMHYQSSYSAARAAMLNAWRTWRIQRDWMATDLCQPIYELWLEEAVAKNRIQAPGFFSDPAIRAAWSAAQWIGDGPGSLDPTKEVQAAQDRVDMGISTLEAESILHDGGDWESKHRQRVKENNLRKEAGLVVEKRPAQAEQPAQDSTNGTV